MKYLATFIFILLCQTLSARPFQDLHRINFFPSSQAFFRLDYQYQNLEIETPRTSFNQHSVRNYLNILDLSYAYRWRQSFFGSRLRYELISLSAANYGIASSQRYRDQGWVAPEIFILSRLRQQSVTTGSIDLFLSYTPYLRAREIGPNSSGRFEGREMYRIRLSHGLVESQWEFKNQFDYLYFAEGKEINYFNKTDYTLKPNALFTYSFTGQYQLRDWLYIFAEVHFEYRTVERILSTSAGERKIQMGTGSDFSLGVKKPLNKWTVVEIKAQLERYSYRVVGESNFDGQASDTRYSISYIKGF